MGNGRKWKFTVEEVGIITPVQWCSLQLDFWHEPEVVVLCQGNGLAHTPMVSMEFQAKCWSVACSATPPLLVCAGSCIITWWWWLCSLTSLPGPFLHANQLSVNGWLEQFLKLFCHVWRNGRPISIHHIVQLSSVCKVAGVLEMAFCLLEWAA